jgi:hypothetical protein
VYQFQCKAVVVVVIASFKQTQDGSRLPFNAERAPLKKDDDTDLREA